MGLRGDAAIVGYVELPPERLNKASPAPFVLEQWAELVRRRTRGCGTARRRRQRHRRPRTWRSRRSSCPRRSPNTSVYGARFAELVDLGGASAAAMVWRAAAAIELGICDAVLCALPAPLHHAVVEEEAQTDDRRDVLRLVEQPIRLSAGRIRDPLRQPRPERALRSGRPALCGASTATTSGRWPRSSSTSASTPTTPRARSGRTSRSPSRTCWPAR